MKPFKKLCKSFPIPIILACVVLFMLSCSEDCPSCPGSEPVEPYAGYAYMSDYVNMFIYQVDTETDSLIDSIACPAEPVYMDVSGDGQFLAVTYAESTSSPFTVIYDAQTLDQLRQLDISVKCHFVADENLMIGYYDHHFYFYSLPDFTLTSSDSIGYFRNGVIAGEQGLIFGLSDEDPSVWDSTFVIAYDYRSRQISDTWRFRDMHKTHTFLDIDVTPSGDKLYAIVKPHRDYKYDYYHAACIDLQNRTEIFSFGKTERGGGAIRLSPDGREVYLAQQGRGRGLWESNTVFILDAMTGSYLHGISFFGLRSYPTWPIPIWSIAFTPDGNKAYVGTGDQVMGYGSMIVIDTRIREIKKLIWPDLRHFSYQVVIGPKV